jgi:SAM-dependent methyltransferase
MENVTVNLEEPSLYAEPDSKFYRLKRKLTYQTILKIVRKKIGKRTDFSLLEIGTGSGFFLSYLEKEFPNAILKGIEYDPRLVSLTQSKVRNAKIIQGNAENFFLNAEKFDIIVSLQVIEHLYNPELMIQTVRKHLKHDGFFIFTTPNLNCFSEKVMKKRWHGYREDHVSLKDVNGWRNFTEKEGFKCLYAGSTFFTGIPMLNKLPLGLINWALLLTLGSLKWSHGESFIGIFQLDFENND